MQMFLSFFFTLREEQEGRQRVGKDFFILFVCYLLCIFMDRLGCVSMIYQKIDLVTLLFISTTIIIQVTHEYMTSHCHWLKYHQNFQ